MILDEKQTNYIFLKAKQLTDKYSKLIPLSEEQSQEFRAEMHKIINDCKGDKLCQGVLIEVGLYLDRECKKGR